MSKPKAVRKDTGQRALTYTTKLDPDQIAVVRKEFPEDEWPMAEVIRCVFRDYFEARKVEWPEDRNAMGGWRNHQRKSE